MYPAESNRELSNFKTVHQTQSPCTIILNSGNGEHFTFFLLVAKAFKPFMERAHQIQSVCYGIQGGSPKKWSRRKRGAEKYVAEKNVADLFVWQMYFPGIFLLHIFFCPSYFSAPLFLW